MAYPKRSLHPGEDLFIDTRPHWWMFSRHIIFTTAVLFMWILRLWFPAQIQSISGWVLLAVTAVVVLWWCIALVRWSQTLFVVTSQRVAERSGIIARHGVEIPIDRITNLNFHQNMWERVIGAGDLELQSAGLEGSTVFRDVWHPDDIQHLVHSLIEKRSPSSMRTGNGDDITSQLSAAAQMLERGQLTSEEFTTIKQRLLRGAQ